MGQSRLHVATEQSQNRCCSRQQQAIIELPRQALHLVHSTSWCSEPWQRWHSDHSRENRSSKFASFSSWKAIEGKTAMAGSTQAQPAPSALPRAGSARARACGMVHRGQRLPSARVRKNKGDWSVAKLDNAPSSSSRARQLRQVAFFLVNLKSPRPVADEARFTTTRVCSPESRRERALSPMIGSKMDNRGLDS